MTCYNGGVVRGSHLKIEYEYVCKNKEKENEKIT